MVEITCCGNRYPNVVETLNHECGQPAKPQMTVRALIAACIASMVLWAVIGTATGVLIGQSQEDDLWANCHIYGDGHCGPGSPWHGFVNLF